MLTQRHALFALALVHCSPSAPTSDGSVTSDARAEVLIDAASDSSRDAIDVDADRARDAAVEAGIDAVTDAADAGPAAFPCVDGRCPSGFNCYTEGCLPAIVAGERCQRSGGLPCVHQHECMRAADGVDRCIERGAEYGSCSVALLIRSGDCNDGLACRDGACHPGLAIGELCEGAALRCNSGSSCRLVDGTRRCVSDYAEGGLCNVCPGNPRSCTAGLSCTGSLCISPAGETCARTVAAGEECSDDRARCGAGLQCVSVLGRRRCAPIGALGAECRTSGAACDAGLTCSSGRCRALVARGGVCDPTGATTVCETGDQCSSSSLWDEGRCAAIGASAGTSCRTSGSSCDSALECVVLARYGALCQSRASLDDPCDMGRAQTICPAGSRCAPNRRSDGAATCASVIAEVEPNERAVIRPASSRTEVISATLGAADSQDCFRMNIVEGGAIFVELDTVALVTELFGPTGDRLAAWAGYSGGNNGPLSGLWWLSPHDRPVLRGLRAGAHTVCFRPREAATVSYRATLGILAP